MYLQKENLIYRGIVLNSPIFYKLILTNFVGYVIICIEGKGAICAPLENLEQEIEKQHLDKNRETIVYCSSTQCDASPQAAQKLEKLGFSKVEDYKAGLKDWEEAGYPVEKSNF